MTEPAGHSAGRGRYLSGGGQVDPDALFAVRCRNLADRYDGLAEEMTQIGEWPIEKVLRQLAIAARNEPEIAQCHGERDPSEPHTRRLADRVGTGEFRTDPADLLSAYAVWAYAVRNEIVLFDELTNLAGQTQQPEHRERLAEFAGRVLDRAAQWRAERRIAFHAERLSAANARFPAVNRIQEYDDLIHVALETETWMQSCLAAVKDLRTGLREARRITEAEVTRLAGEAGYCVASKRLHRQLKRLAAATAEDTPAMAAEGRVRAEAERLFDYYDAIFDAATGEDLHAEAQRLSQAALARIRSLSS